MPTEQELKNELFKLREILMKKEEEVRQIKGKMAEIEKQLGMAQPVLAAPIPDLSTSAAPAPKPASSPTLAAPIPSTPTPSAPIPSAPIPSAPTPSAPTPSPARRKAILQKVPSSGPSQLHARETQFECPNCGSHYNMEVDDKSRILYVVGAGTRIYAKKHRCMNCGNEWAD